MSFVLCAHRDPGVKEPAVVARSDLDFNVAAHPQVTVPVDMWLHRTGRLAGGWRRTATENPRDHTWHDRLLRWVINHPIRSVVIGLATVVVVYVALLLMGPPAER